MSVSKPEERDEQEVMGYFQALDTISVNFASIKITERQIKNLHKILMQFSEHDAWHRGNYKQVSNVVEANLADGTKQIVFRTTHPGIETEDAMKKLIDWYASDNDTIPLLKTALFVYEFLSIHPFQDGNGRLSRLLAHLLLLKNGYTWIQYVSLEHEIENRKSDYYRVLMQTQRNRPGENVTEWVSYFISCLTNIQTQLMAKLEKSNSESPISLRKNHCRKWCFSD
jgi:Fic family protein